MTERSALRLVLLQVLVVALLLTLGARLWQVQVVGGPQYEAQAVQQRVREVVLPAPRGRILDAAGRPLVANRTAVVVSVDREVLRRQPDGGAAVLDRLARLLGEPADRLRDGVVPCGEPGAAEPPRCWNGSPYAPVPVATDVPARLALQVVERSEDFPGVLAETRQVRTLPRPSGVLAPHLLGYVDGEDAGRAGLEAQYDELLSGRPGTRRVAVDPAGRVLRVLGDTAPAPGTDLVTSVDARVQAVVERQLAAAVRRARETVDPVTGRRYVADSGAAVVLEARTGRVVAMASWPTYDPQVWLGGISTRELTALTAQDALLSRPTQAQLAPASPFKVVSAAAAASAGWALDDDYPCTSSFRVGDRSFRNYETRAHGDISVGRALEVSCDTVFYRFAYEMWRRDGGNRPVDRPRDLLSRTAAEFGLGRRTGVDLPGEEDGRVADRTWKREWWEATRDAVCAEARRLRDSSSYAARLAREGCSEGWRWRAGDAVNASIGQGDTLVTPLQMAVAYAAIANGGSLWQPQLATEVRAADGRVVRELRPNRTGTVDVPRGVLAYLRSALHATTVRGTGARPFAGFPLDRVPIATKTGTAEVDGKQTTSWFVSFDRDLVVLMTVTQGGTGSGTSGPSVRRIWEALRGVQGSVVDPAKALWGRESR